jgi:hypothetical protein
MCATRVIIRQPISRDSCSRGSTTNRLSTARTCPITSRHRRRPIIENVPTNGRTSLLLYRDGKLFPMLDFVATGRVVM